MKGGGEGMEVTGGVAGMEVTGMRVTDWGDKDGVTEMEVTRMR